MSEYRPQFREFEASAYDLELDMEEIYRNMGMEGCVPQGEVADILSDMLDEIRKICFPSYGFALYPVTKRSSKAVAVGGIPFNTGGIITRFFSDAEYSAVFVATAGDGFDEWCRSEAVSTDVVRAFIADSIGSEIAEAAARLMASVLASECEALGLKRGNSYSPGYCRWDVGEQHLLFNLLPPYPCGISLNTSGLMTPVKSVSGFIPVGAGVKKMAYGCDICRRPDCYKNKRKKQDEYK